MTTVVLVYIALVLDNVLLTVVGKLLQHYSSYIWPGFTLDISVPIVPDYLYNIEHPKAEKVGILQTTEEPMVDNGQNYVVSELLKNLNESLFGKGRQDNFIFFPLFYR